MALQQIYWPDSLPQEPLASSYETTMSRDVVTSEFDVGMKRQRKRSSNVLNKVTCKYFLRTELELEAFKAFVDLANARSFWWPSPNDGLKDDSDPSLGFVQRYARFAEEPKVSTDDGLHWTASLTLEIWPDITSGPTSSTTAQAEAEAKAAAYAEALGVGSLDKTASVAFVEEGLLS